MNWDRQIRARLHELRRKLLNLALLEGAWRAAVLLAGLCLVAALLEFSFGFSPAVRIWLLWICVLCLVTALGTWLIRPLLGHLFRPISSEALALRWGRSLVQVNDRLLNALQVYEHRQQEATSPELAELALETVGQELQGASYSGVLDRSSLRRARRMTYVLAACWLAALLLTRGSLGNAFLRLLQPNKNFGPILPYSLHLEEVPPWAIRGEPFEVMVRGRVEQSLNGGLPRTATLRVQEREEEPADFTISFDDSGYGRQMIANPQEDLRLWVFAGRVSSDTARVKVKSRPFIKELQVRWIPPAYSGLPAGSAVEKRGDVSALKGSRVNISLTGDRELSSAELRIYADERPDQPASAPMQVDDETATAEFVLWESGHYNLILQDKDGLGSAAPVDYSLWPIADETPSVEITYPPAEAELNESLIVPLKAQARDDFAISRLRLGYRLIKGGQTDTSGAKQAFAWNNLAFDNLGEGNFYVDFLWDLNGLNLLPGDEIIYCLEAQDNDLVTGPKHTLSSEQRLRFPTLEEIFARMEEGQGEQVQNVQEALDQSQAMKEELEKLSEELKSNPDLPWEERKQVEELLKRQEDMARQVQEMSRQAEQMIQQMEENQLLAPETLQKYQELQKLLSEVLTPELMQAMQKLQEALEKQDPEALRRAVEEFSVNQEEFLARMEKTMNILKQLQMEMKLDELAKRAEELLEKQQNVNEKLDQAEQEGSRPEEAQAEAQLQREMEAFQQEFQKTQELLAESPYNPQEAMKEAEQLMEENQFPQSMNQMSKELQEGSNSSARQKGSKIQNGLAQLSQKMKEAQEQMVDKSKGELAEALKKLSHDLLGLSYQQEDLLDTSNTMDKASPRFRSQAQQQQALKNHLEKIAKELFQLSQKSFFITPQMGAAVDQAFRGMDQALGGYTARNPQSVAQQQQTAMGGMNRTIMEIGQSLEQLSASSSSTGFSEMMEQLSKMAGEQGQINQGTMALIPGGTNPGTMSMEQQAALSRLAAQQAALQQQLEDLNQANQQTQQMMGRLGELGEEMREVVQDLQNRQVDERTLKRQERILTRLLDAQRSVREREYRKERLSRTAQGDYFQPAPGEADQNLQLDQARERLLRALREGYTRDYQQLVRAYFEAMAREN